MARGPAELPARLAAYVAAVGTRETAVQRRLRRATSRIPMGTMQIGPDQAAFMQVLVRAIGAKRCLEIGTFTGYSALAVALALPPGGKVFCCDVSEEWTSIARRFWKAAKVGKKIELRLAPALETLKKLKGPFDFAFIDADKANYQNYFERCLKLVRRGGMIAIDNTLWHGRVLQQRDQSADTRAIRAFNRRLRRDRRVEMALVPIGDGLTLALKR
ncbi:MAG TPA: class I SAM-dependent methyltransferase [Burkholderiales bacterium]|nr:class I SAM-dependent methyltransferase [Burkholderiales bacterium]